MQTLITALLCLTVSAVASVRAVAQNAPDRPRHAAPDQSVGAQKRESGEPGSAVAPGRGVDCAAIAGRSNDSGNGGVCVLTALRLADSMPRPELDGRLDEAAWELAVPATGFVQFTPDPGEPASERTEARILHDGSTLYVGMRMFDSRPDSIRAQFVRRDDAEASSDWAHVLIDSYHDRRTAFHFATTPTGARVDILRLEDTEQDVSWNAVWDVATRVEDWGWSAEFRIPLSQLRFGGGPDMVWGINFMRDIARRSEQSWWVEIPPESGRLVSLFGDLAGLEDLDPPGRLELLPYSLGQVRREDVDPADPFREKSDWRGSLGVDLKYGLTSDLTLTATVNPDFGQVEADPSVVNLGTTETFLTERRPFFTEGAEIFRFPMQPEGHAFYSRRIGRPPQLGVSVPAGGYTDVPATSSILGAVKLSGKTRSGWSIGLVHALTEKEEARIQDADLVQSAQPVEPLTNYSAGRIVRDFRNGASGLGILATAVHRDNGDPAFDRLHSSAYVAAIDGWHRFGGDRFQTSGWVLGSLVRGAEAAIAATQRSLVHLFQRPDAGNLTFDPTRTSLSGIAAEYVIEKIGGGHWTWSASGGLRTPGVETNDVGFLSYTDAWYASWLARYSEFTPGPLLRSWHAEGEAVAASTFGGDLIRPSLHLRTRAQMNNFWVATLNLDWWQPYLWPWELRGGPILRRQGYFNWRGTLTSDSRTSWRLQLRGTLRTEDEIDARTITLDPVLDLRPTSRATVSLSPAVTWNRDPDQYVASSARSDGDAEYVMGRLEQTTASLTLRLSYAFTPDMTFDFYGQPFVSSGRYTAFTRVVEPRERRWSHRVASIDAATISIPQNRYLVDEDGDGVAEFDFRNRDFNVRELRTNAVLRWEYRPGSVLFLVWSQARDDDVVTGALDFGHDIDRLFEAPAQHVFLIKLSYWLGY